jgi:hypothetical protein
MELFMSFVFKENFTVSLPPHLTEGDGAFQNFSESVTDAGIIVEISAIHAGYTENNTFYSAEELKKAVASWVTPYPKPVIMNHDVTTEPVGRVVGAKMDQEENGKEFIRIQAMITDPKAIEKVLDKRYMTGSIGGKADVALCSICNTDWASKEAANGIPCKHQRGKSYEGTIATLKLGDLSFKEYSFVNVPADSHSYIRSVQTATDGKPSSESDESWAKPSRFFIFSLNDRKVTEFIDTDQKTTFSIGEMETNFLYDIMDLDSDNYKSLFVDNESTDNTNENVQTLLLQEFNMQTEQAEIDQEDILAVTEQLANDLSADTPADDTQVEEAEETVEETVADDSVEESDEQVETAEESEEVTEEDSEVTEEEPVEEPVAEEPAVEEPEVEQTEETPEAEDDSEKEEEQDGLVTEDSVEPEIDSLKEQVASLQEENTNLRKALHKTLAERVVDAKISVGIEELANRSDAIEEHSSRSASSLADSLRDLAKLPPVKKEALAVENLTLNVESAAVDEDGEPSSTLTESEVAEEKVVKPETIFVEKMSDILSGRTQLH